MDRHIKKIGFIIFSVSNAGGSERIACGLANELAKRNYEISIITVYRSNISFFPLAPSIGVYNIFKNYRNPSKYLFPFVPFRLVNVLKRMKQKPDVLLCVGTDQAVYASLSVLLFKIKLVSWEHFNYTVNRDVLITKLGRKITSLLAQDLVVLTQTDKQMFEKDASVKTPVRCIPNFMTFPVTVSASIESYTAIAIGRYTYQKGFDTLIKIWGKVAAQHAQWKLLIIGDGEEKTKLSEMIQENGLENKISLISLSSNVSVYYTHASLFLLSSRWEGLPMVLIEAKSFGLPIVSFDCNTGPRDVIQNGVDGILVPDQDIDAFATAVNDLLANRSLLQQMGKQSLLNSRQFSAETVVPMWEKLFAEL